MLRYDGFDTGITIEYNKDKQAFIINGYYDGGYGNLDEFTVPLKELMNIIKGDK